jgi:cyanate lyase
MRKKGATYAQIAQQTGLTEQRVTDICAGNANASKDEFKLLAAALEIANDGHHPY